MTDNHKNALDLAKQGKWEEAHEAVRSGEDKMSCLIHGYLHRVEGDLDNARYWYAQAGSAIPGNTIEEEWERLRKLVGSSVNKR